MKQGFAILIKHGRGVMLRLMDDEIIKLIKQYNGAAVLGGYNQALYIACLVFQRKEDRDKFGDELSRRGFEFVERDDALI